MSLSRTWSRADRKATESNSHLPKFAITTTDAALGDTSLLSLTSVRAEPVVEEK